MTESQALELAKHVATTNEWPWIEPIAIRKRRRFWGRSFWTIRTNCDQRGCNVSVEIDDVSQHVVKAVFHRR
jgi:hypothetical protein